MSQNQTPPTSVLPRLPHRPWRWLGWLLLSQVLVAVLWWQLGTAVGLATMLLSHAAFVLPVFLPNCALYAPVLSRWHGAGDRVWLTIDDGPSQDTPALLALLERHQARATFFLVGARASQHPERVRAILAAGHSIGNHSHDHPQARYWALGPQAMAQQIGHCQQALTAIAGSPPRWYRSVVGHTNPLVAGVLARHGLQRVGWSARGYDGVAADVPTVLARITPGLQPGAIVLLHEGGPPGQAEAVLAGVLDALAERGLRADIPG